MPNYLIPLGRRSLRLSWRSLSWGALLIMLIPAAPSRAESLVRELDPELRQSTDSVPPVMTILCEEDQMIESSTLNAWQRSAGGGIQVTADALFWTVREGSADNWAQVITPKDDLGSLVGTATLVDAPFDWNTGFRVGVGYQPSTGDSDVALFYTSFTTKATSRAAGEVYSAFLGNFFVDNTDGDAFGPHYRSANIRWDFDFHTIDLQVRRSFPVADNLTVRPFVGFKTAFINQSLKSSWRQPIDTFGKIYLFDSASENLKQDFWGIGPSLGVTLQVPLCQRPRYSLNVFGTPSGSLMYGRWTFSDVYTNDGLTSIMTPTPTTISIDTSPITGVATMVRGVMGIEWKQHFARASTTVRIGYEAQTWLNQMQFYSYNMGRLNNLMALHGGVLEFCITH
jgi:hypothetical protein